MKCRIAVRKVFRLIILLGVGIGFLGELVFGDDLSEEIRVLENFSKAYNVIKNQHVNQVDSDKLIKAAISGMVKSLDPYSDVLTQKDLEKLELHSVGQYVGIGVTIQKSNEHFTLKNGSEMKSQLLDLANRLSLYRDRLNWNVTSTSWSNTRAELDIGNGYIVETGKYQSGKARVFINISKNDVEISKLSCCLDDGKYLEIIRLYESVINHSKASASDVINNFIQQEVI